MSDKLKTNNLKIYGGEDNDSPIRFCVARLHGDEWRDTSGLLLNITPPENGTLAVIPIVDNGEYVSTLDERYYTTLDSRIIDAINSLHPNVYVELHSYSAASVMSMIKCNIMGDMDHTHNDIRIGSLYLKTMHHPAAGGKVQIP